ncbi:MAG: putative RAMP superfamily DNA repair protein [Promethearchaeota archaeon]|nr:MAG: putative RAMP superfamily DNA repair protein [Candidatus Lokiarchaeota archaeon]
MVVHHAIKLVPKTPFHLGEMMDMESTEDIIHSDTIYSALCRISDVFFGKAEYKKFIDPFLNEDPSFIISSAFPYYEAEKETIFFFPKPLIFKDFVAKNPKAIKTYKKIRFVSKHLLNAFLNNDDEYLHKNFMNENGKLKRKNLIQNGQVWLSEAEKELIPYTEDLWKIQRSPRVVIDRSTKNTSIFHYSRIHFHKGKTGLYLLIDNLKKNENIAEELITKFRYLGDTGLGGERSTGNGQFSVMLNKSGKLFHIELDQGDNSSKRFLSLSLFLPKEEEINNNLIGDNNYYSIINRKGWISGTSYRRRNINMITEGSVLNTVNSKIYGRIEEITPNILKTKHPDYKIHRFGYSYSINLKN